MGFLDRTTTVHPTAAGDVELPIRYHDATQLGVFFRVPLDRARSVVARQAIEPWPIFGTAICAIYAWQYHESSLGPYGEVGLGIQCRRSGARPSLLRLLWNMGLDDDQGIWVENLPVTTEAAKAAGIELWGYPKYVTPISVAEEGADLVARLGDEMELRVGRLNGITLKSQPIVTDTDRGGRLVRTCIETEHPVAWGTGGSSRLVLRGDGPLARTARALGLESTPVVAAFRATKVRAVLPAGVDLGSIGAQGPEA